MEAAECQVSLALLSRGFVQRGGAGAVNQREGEGRREETELKAVNRFAFYGVREFISGHSPDGCNKLVKCEPP